MYDCVCNPKYSVHNSSLGKILLQLCFIYFNSFLILPYYTVLSGNNLFHLDELYR